MGEKFIINISGNNYEVVACCEAEALRTLAKQLEDARECDPYRDCPDRTDLLIVKPYKTKPDMTDFDNPTGDGSPLKITAIKNGKFITEQVESVKHKEVEQISPDRPNYFICKHCGKPTPKLPDVHEKLNGLFITDKRVVTAINSLIDCYSALKKVVEEKL